MFNLILYQPEIPPNTGNIIRLCANTGTRLHLVGPLGFTLDDARLRRAGLDYGEWAELLTYPHWEHFLQSNPDMPLWAFSTHGRRRYSDAAFRAGDGLMFGPETRGLPAAVLGYAGEKRTLRLPMQEESRSLNLSNCAAIGLYEALRQSDFTGLA
ncbi:MAG: tRNA (cytidine(34)-2'-O)-methyltransferase [Xanthomonadales bacterium]|nr:tRNA (cytidine(34)-2'-O)-methyltransferase [Xanthomonadales bacterium]